ncbi:MAG TPA: UDP-N-acetylmuramate dehydrogenase [Acidimicrobiia bacterium]|jgi:UDP-N-acetylmuramate dehydrogenase
MAEGAWDRLVEAGAGRADVELAGFTTYKLGGPARYWFEVADRSELASLSAAYAEEPLPVLVMGRGSNLVVSDLGFPGVVVRLGAGFGEYRVEPEVKASAAVSLPQLARAAVKAGRLGLEFLVGIPGTVGGAVRQNAGCFGREMADVIIRAEVYDLAGGLWSQLSPGELKMGYRVSSVQPHHIVTAAELRSTSGDPAAGEVAMREITRWRRDHQPGGTYNAGSVFKNPPGDAAGRIIDQLGLKGFRVGAAAVSDKHANFFVTMPGATATDVYRLVGAVAARVRDATGVALEPEIQFVGEFEQEA